MGTTHKPTKPVSSFLGSPRFFNGFLAKTLSDVESSSPTSVLDTKQLFSAFGSNPFGFKQSPVKPRKIFQESNTPSEKFEPENGIALALVEENPNGGICKPNAISRKVLFGSKLRIQVPSHPFPNGSLEDSGDYGIKTWNSQLSGAPTASGSGSPRASMGALSLNEMELSEDYTRVISHGSNPKITHIYHNCVVGSCCGALHSDPHPKSPCQGFLSFCHTCNTNLGEDADIFMYRGEKAFCSGECRDQEMVLDGLMNSDQLFQ